jgi:hypothetical protein
MKIRPLRSYQVIQLTRKALFAIRKPTHIISRDTQIMERPDLIRYYNSATDQVELLRGNRSTDHSRSIDLNDGVQNSARPFSRQDPNSGRTYTFNPQEPGDGASFSRSYNNGLQCLSERRPVSLAIGELGLSQGVGVGLITSIAGLLFGPTVISAIEKRAARDLGKTSQYLRRLASRNTPEGQARSVHVKRQIKRLQITRLQDSRLTRRKPRKSIKRIHLSG